MPEEIPITVHDRIGCGAGTDDGLVDPGEFVRIGVPFQNTGQVPLHEPIGELRVLSPHVTIHRAAGRFLGDGAASRDRGSHAGSRSDKTLHCHGLRPLVSGYFSANTMTWIRSTGYWRRLRAHG